MSKFLVVSAVLYVACMAAVVAGFRSAREAALRNYGSEAAAADWQVWRSAAEKHNNGEGPVRRKPPRSEKPPALMLMQEHYYTCLALSLLLTSVLFATITAMAHGAYRPTEPFHDE